MTPLAANMRVRLLGDPTRIGFLTGRTRPGRGGSGQRFQVKFPDTTSWIPDDQLEPVPTERESPIDLFQSGRFGRARDLRRTLTHIRLTGRLADIIYSMETTNTDFYPYQFKPVLRYLQSPSNALLIADEVGLGKTIEAGLVWTELRSRFDLRRLLVLCPAILREKWRLELRNKIGVMAEVVNAAGLVRALADLDPRGFSLICSLEGARPPSGWSDDPELRSGQAELARLLRSRESDAPLLDLVIIDEAHYLRNPKSQTNELGHLFRPVAEHLLMLTATPIHNYNQDLFALLNLLDGDTFQRPDDLRLILDASRPLVAARDALLSSSPSAAEVHDLVERATMHPLLRGNRQLALVLERLVGDNCIASHESRATLARMLELVNPLAYVITRTRKRDVKEWRVVREPVPEAVPMRPPERAFYQCVTDLVIRYAMTRAVNERFILASPQRQMSSSMAATLRAWQRRRENLDDVNAASHDAGPGDDVGPLMQEILQRADTLGDVAELMANDSKYARLLAILTDFFKEHPVEKVVLFSTFRETLNYLNERLERDGIRSILLHGGILDDKDNILQRFGGDPAIRVLLSSEVGSEGIDLQFCRVLINYDLPWNPMRIEQRIGRLDRLGQNAERILIWNLFYAETIDSRIYKRLYEKLDLCRTALGDFEAVLGDEIRQLTIDLLSDCLSPDQQERRIDQTAQALANLRHEQEHLEGEASHLIAYGDYILRQIQAAHELNRWITGDDLRTYVVDYLNLHYPGCVIQQVAPTTAEFDVVLSARAKQDLEDFIRSQRLPVSTRLTQGSAWPVRCRFENRTTSSQPASVELISQFHPLVRFVAKGVSDGEEQLTPAVSVEVDGTRGPGGGFEPGTYLLAGAHWSVNGLRAVERLVFAGARVDEPVTMLTATDAERLANLCAESGRDWSEGPKTADLARLVNIADGELFANIEAAFREFVDEVKRQNEDRADLQLRNLERHLASQRAKLEEILARHRAYGRDSLAKATEGRIGALMNRLERQRVTIEKQRPISYRQNEVLLALVGVRAEQGGMK